jgi:hypothetical protein
MVVVPTISRALHLEDRPNGGNRQRTAFVHALTLAKFVADCRVWGYSGNQLFGGYG